MNSTSPPAQNARPAPVITTTRTSASFSHARSASSRSSRIVPVKRVELLGTVEGDRGDGVADGAFDEHGGAVYRYHPRREAAVLFRDLRDWRIWPSIALVALREPAHRRRSPVWIVWSVFIDSESACRRVVGIARPLGGRARSARPRVLSPSSAAAPGSPTRCGWSSFGGAGDLRLRLDQAGRSDLSPAPVRSGALGARPGAVLRRGADDVSSSTSSAHRCVPAPDRLVVREHLLRQRVDRVRVGVVPIPSAASASRSRTATRCSGSSAHGCTCSCRRSGRRCAFRTSGSRMPRRCASRRGCRPCSCATTRTSFAPANGTAVTEPIRIVFGIGAFPSLHVAFQTYVFLWTRRALDGRAGAVRDLRLRDFPRLDDHRLALPDRRRWLALRDGIRSAYRVCFPKHADDDPGPTRPTLGEVLSERTSRQRRSYMRSWRTTRVRCFSCGHRCRSRTG